MAVSICLGLITTRFVLQALGTQDFGIYVLVGGVVATFGFLNSTMSSSSARFIAFSIGKNDSEDIQTTFNTSFVVHVLIAVIVAAMIEIGGYWMFKLILNIPAERVGAAKFVFHCMMLSTFFLVITVPYDAMITAHEEFFILSVFDIIQSIAKLFIAIYLLYSNGDRLIFYGSLILTIQVFALFLKWFYAKNHYKECKLIVRKYTSRNLMREMMSFAGWNLFGTLSTIGSTQISAIIINSFFGVKLNAATGIARRVNNHLRNVSVNLTRALLPQLIKSEGAGDRKKMLKITMISAKFSVFVYSLIAIPFIFEANYLIEKWLVTVPDGTELFIQLFLISALIEKFTFPLTDSFRAVGDIKRFQITESLLLLGNLPVALCLYLLFEMPPATIFYTEIIFRLAVMIERLYFAKKICELNILTYIDKVFLRSGIPVAVALTFLIFITWLFPPGILRLGLSFVFVNIVHSILFAIFGMTQNERDKIFYFLKHSTAKLKATGFIFWKAQ